MSNDDGVALMRERYGDKWADMLQYYLDNFVDSLTGVVPGARVLINDLKAAGVRVWGLSNWQKDLFPIALDNSAQSQRSCGFGVRFPAQAQQGYLRVRVAAVWH